MIVWEGKAPNGATVRIDDGLCAPKGSEQERRIVEEQRRIAHRILIAAAERRAKEKAVSA